ncbi:MarR family transcriptional regulator [Streptomyces sp. NPDC035033]|uniref:MarR family transcriptional regulator n=1 Tax=Streptomyces sp. NPDC035033 TaxID=3155368 RepID=UPI0033F5245A
MGVTLQEYTREELAAQPVGAWTGMASRLVVGALRAQLAVEGLTQPHWWTLNHVAGKPGFWTRAALVERLARWDDARTDFDAVFDDLVARGWLTEDAGSTEDAEGTGGAAAGRMTLTEEGEAGRLRARERNAVVHRRVHEGIDPEEYATTVDVLRRMVANMGGDGNLPS